MQKLEPSTAGLNPTNVRHVGCVFFFFFFRTFFGHWPIFYEMNENFYAISDKMSEKYLAALLRVYSLKKTFRKTQRITP